MSEISDYLEADAEGALVFVPVGAEHLETAYLGGAADMLADAGTDIIVADTDQTDGIGSIIGQTVETDIVWQLIAGDELECNGQVFLDELVHTTLYLLFLLARRLVVEMEAHLALLPLDMGIIGTLTAKDTDHGLIQKMLCRMTWRVFFFIVVVQDIVVCHKITL